MKDSDFLPKSESISPLEKYAKAHLQLREKVIEDNPEIDYLQYDDGLLLASPVEYPIIDEGGGVGKSYLTNELGVDITEDVAKTFVKEFHIEEKELYRFLGFRDKHVTSEEFKYAIFAYRIRAMFDYFEELLPEINEKRFPKEQIYSEIEKSHKVTNHLHESVVVAEIIFANTRMMVKNGLMKKEDADEVLKIQLLKAFGSR